MISVRNISKRFGKLQVLRGVEAEFNAGSCTMLIGPNGSGKTTLIKSILGMVFPDQGSVLFDGRDVKQDWSYRSYIGYMPQMTRYPENMSIGQLFDMMTDLRDNEQSRDEDLLNAYGLHQLRPKKLGTLSGGTRQKVGASLAFLFNPKVLILDEPTAGLDPVAAEVLKEKIKCELEKGKVMIITSHVLSELEGLATDVMMMQDGSVLFHNGVDELKNETGEYSLPKIVARKLKT